ncbi:MAG: DUF262 domain-containing HNH endonuclease family protein [Ignavibacteria bacterium]|jgi:uncharacterized protein with ParB-like and HNH nuclease domain|nr:DUF262 domain-containing HNH endonuclease family protein [Ignavibacteria bacterium]MDH7527735.1 DUF262 domain-containing HNH endonuclease family protein [Ignavibacteria bacterium]
MPKPFFDTKTLNISEILGNAKTYYVPRFQRSYSWQEEHWEDLWQDIINLKNDEEKIHYLGTIVLKTSDNKTFEVIDGQQRLATLSIIILACIQKIEFLAKQGIDSEKNLQRKELYLNNYIGYKDAKSLTYKPKLVLNDTDKDLYNSYIVQLRKPASISNLPDSNKLLIKAFDYFKDKIDELDFKNGEEIVDFIDQIILNRLILIQIVVEDTLSAYTVFETLNARGVELTTTDLLKNYLFSLLDNQIDIDNALPIWDRIVNIVSYREFPVFLRYYLNSFQNLIRNERLFKELRNKVSSKDEVFHLLEELEKNAELYVAFDDSDHEYWLEKPTIQNLIQELNLFGVKQHKSLLLAAYNKLNIDLFEKTLRIIRAITFRYNVIGKFNPNELEKVYNKAAIKIHNSQLKSASDIQKELNSVYINDENFRSLFIVKSFELDRARDKKLVRYILLNFENQKFNKNYHLFESDATIEHIIPRSSKTKAKNLTDKLNSIGNLTLLEPGLNREAMNKSFQEKLKIYERSQYELTKEIAREWTEFGLNEIKIRQRKFADLATSIWRVEY